MWKRIDVSLSPDRRSLYGAGGRRPWRRRPPARWRLHTSTAQSDSPRTRMHARNGGCRVLRAVSRMAPAGRMGASGRRVSERWSSAAGSMLRVAKRICNGFWLRLQSGSPGGRVGSRAAACVGVKPLRPIVLASRQHRQESARRLPENEIDTICAASDLGRR